MNSLAYLYSMRYVNAPYCVSILYSITTRTLESELQTGLFLSLHVFCTILVPSSHVVSIPPSLVWILQTTVFIIQFIFQAYESSSPPAGSLSRSLAIMIYIWVFEGLPFLITNQQLLAATGSSLAAKPTLSTVQHFGDGSCDWQCLGSAGHPAPMSCCASLTLEED